MTQTKKYIGITELATKYAMKEDITKKEADRILREVLNLVREELLDETNDGIQIVDFLTLRKVERGARVGRNPKKPDVDILIPNKKGIKCILGKAFSQELNKELQ